jgi:hypothetical protein
MSNVNPVDRLSLTQRLRKAIQAVTDDAEDTFHTGLDQGLRDKVRDIIYPHGAFLT